MQGWSDFLYFHVDHLYSLSCLKISNSAYGQLISICKLYTYRSNKLKKFNDGRIHEVVTLSVGQESFDDRLKKFVCCDVAVV